MYATKTMFILLTVVSIIVPVSAEDEDDVYIPFAAGSQDFDIDYEELVGGKKCSEDKMITSADKCEEARNTLFDPSFSNLKNVGFWSVSQSDMPSGCVFYDELSGSAKHAVIFNENINNENIRQTERAICMI